MVKQCQRCGADYEPTGHCQKYCPQCQKIARYEYQRSWLKQHPEQNRQYVKASNEKKKQKLKLEQQRERLRIKIRATLEKQKAEQLKHELLYPRLKHWEDAGLPAAIPI